MELEQKYSSRRKFIVSLIGTGILMNSKLSFGSQNQMDEKVAKIVAKAMAIDTHNHVDVRIYPDQPLPKYNLLADFKKSGLAAIVMTFAVDYQKLQNEGDGYNRFMAGIDAADNLLKEYDLQRALNLSDLKSAFKKKKPTIIQSVEGGHFLEGKIERLKPAYDRGLRVLGLLHDNDAAVPLGDIYTKEPVFGGLSPFGREVVAECNKLGILIDLTHCSNKAIDDALKISTKPIIITHTSLDSRLGNNEKMAQMMKPRLISKEQAKIVANAGGVIGVWRHLTDTPADYVQNIRAMVDTIGVDNVCIGTDTKVTRAIKPNDNSTPRLGEFTNGIWQNQQSGFFYEVVAEMLKTGFSEKEIIKIGSTNFLRVFDASTK
ncbi:MULTISPECIES: dipeptidase [Emticicia]|uniref:dipeptidase n=1 Tax=Emticicia TaxID=312278 RepID=UPI0007D8C10E|nr:MULTISPECIES: membrane dipeptidase [Emticicia]